MATAPKSSNVAIIESELAKRPELAGTGGAVVALALAKILDSETAAETTILGAAKELRETLKTMGILTPGVAAPTDEDDGDRMDKMRDRFERRRAAAAAG